MRTTTLSYTCERRSEYITDGEACVRAFVHCCKTMESQRAEAQEDNLQLARSKGLGQGVDTYSTRLMSLIRHFHHDTLGEEADNSYMDADEITSRTQFPESWLWSEIILPSCPPKTPNW